MRRSSRCYLRGTSRLGLFNTVIGCLFNRVLVRRVDDQTKETVGWFWDKATKWPRLADEKGGTEVKEQTELKRLREMYGMEREAGEKARTPEEARAELKRLRSIFDMEDEAEE